jgi:hypothetical protein
MADHLGRGRVGSLLDILTQESNAGCSRGVPEPGATKSKHADALEAWWEIKQAAAAVPPAA